MLKRISFVVLNAFFVSVILASPCFAAFKASPWKKEVGYNQQMGKKLVFGLGNLTVGPLEIFEEPCKAIKEDRMVWLGLAQGIFNGVLDTIGGALHVVTFLITPIDIPLPEGGTDILQY